MKNLFRVHPAVMPVAFLALSIHAQDSHAFGSYGDQVDTACQAFNGTTPADDQGCGLCHTSPFSRRVEPAWTYWDDRTLTEFCPPTPVNRPPDGRIDGPTADVVIDTGDSISFSGTGTDPDGDQPLSYRWTFGGAAPDSTVEDPGNVRFNSAGVFTVRLTVTDPKGLADATPATRRVTVQDPIVCTDNDGDTFNQEGGPCGAVDCNDNDAAVRPGATENCGDGIDNNCNGLVDDADPVAVGCPVMSCMDLDGDLFSADGGVCGPIDCDDFNARINPGVSEACADNADNDCDGLVDSADPECDGGGDCVQAHFGLQIDRASWSARRTRLVVLGSEAEAGATVTVRDADSGVELGTATVRRSGRWRFVESGPVPVPCRIRAEIDGRFGQREVANAPVDCGDGEFDVNILRATWRARNATLLVVGNEAPAGAEVSIVNAATGTVLGSTDVRNNGRWRLVAAQPASVPCRVRVEIRGQVAEKDVNNAPADCDDGTVVNQAPSCSLDAPAADVTIFAGESVSFAGSGADPEGAPVTYAWDFAGGAANSAAKDPGSVRFLNEGTFRVSFRVTDSEGLRCANPTSRTIDVLPRPNQAPSCTINTPAGNITIEEGQSVNFAGAGADPDGNLPLTYRWNFGGGAANSSLEAPGRVTFNEAGTFTVRFVVTDSKGLGCASPRTRVITVNEEEDDSGEDDFDAHPISANYAQDRHEDDWERRPSFCRTCHGSNLQGTPASATFAPRQWRSDDRQPDGSRTKRYAEGDIVGCADCHGNPLRDDDDDDDEEEDDRDGRGNDDRDGDEDEEDDGDDRRRNNDRDRDEDDDGDRRRNNDRDRDEDDDGDRRRNNDRDRDEDEDGDRRRNNDRDRDEDDDGDRRRSNDRDRDEDDDGDRRRSNDRDRDEDEDD